MMTREQVDAGVRKAVLETSQKKIKIKDSHRFLTDLGFDSLRMVSLSLALENEFGRPLLLNEWLGGAADVTALTVGSLCDYVWEIVNLDE